MLQAVAMRSGSNGILCDVSNPMQATLFGWDGMTLSFEGQFLSASGAFAAEQTILDFPPGEGAAHSAACLPACVPVCVSACLPIFPRRGGGTLGCLLFGWLADWLATCLPG